MSQPGNPWQPQGPQSPPPRVNRLGAFVIILAVLGALVWILNIKFPGMLQTRSFGVWAIFLTTLSAVLARAFVATRRWGARQSLANIGIWIGIVALIVFAYLAKDGFGNLLPRFQAAVMPGHGVETASHEYTISADDNGDFVVLGTVNGATVRFTVDTGASDVVLSPDDAKHAGINVSTLAFIARYGSANGTGHGAFVTLDTLTVGPIQYRQVPATVTRRNMDSSLLGMTFLKRMKSFEFSQNKLILRW